jgi:hypothetical protein
MMAAAMLILPAFQMIKSEWKPDIRSEKFFWQSAALFFAVLVLINYFPVFQGQVPLPGALVTQFPAFSEYQPGQPRTPVADIGDLIDYFYPSNAFSARQIRSGTLPLWNPYVMSGLPFQAEPQTALFYPFHVLYYVFSTPTAWSISLIIRMWLAAMFMTLLLRTLGASKLGSIIAGLAFAFGGFQIAWQGAVMGDAVIWLPLVCYSVIRLHRDKSRLSLALAAVAFAMPVLAGHPETAIHLSFTGCALALLLWVFPQDSTRRFDLGFLLMFSLTGMLAIGLSSVQLIPTLEWVYGSGRDFHVVWPPFEWRQSLGFFSRDILRGPNSAGIFVPNAVGYVGMLTLLLAAVGLLHPARLYVGGLLALAAFGVAATFGVEPVRWILTHIPVVETLKNERLILLADFALAALAGLGTSMLQEKQAALGKVKLWMAWILLALAFAASFYCVYELRRVTTVRVETMRRPSFSRTLLLAGLVVVGWKLIRGDRSRWFSAVAPGLLTFDLLTFAYGYTGFTLLKDVFPPAPIFDFLRQQGRPETFRIMQGGADVYTSNSGIFYGLQSLSGYDVSVMARLRRFIRDFDYGYMPSVNIVGDKLVAANDRRIDMLNVRYIVAYTNAPEYSAYKGRSERFVEVFKRGDIAVFENKTVLPRAFVVPASGVRVVQDPEEQLTILKDPSFDASRTVILDAPPGHSEESASRSDGSAFKGDVKTVDADVNGYRFQVEVSTPAVLVVSQTFFPGWKALANGVSLPVFPADIALTGIAVPTGNYNVNFVFDPGSFRLGVWISAGSVLILSGIVVLSARVVRK